MISHPQPELRNAETIRAYLEELVRLKAPMQFWLPSPGALPFDATLERVGPDSFSITTTPALETGQVLNLAFMLSFRRFVSQTQTLTSGMFRIPTSIRHGERRAHPRAAFDRNDRAEVLAVEQVLETFPGGRTLQGKLLELSVEGLRMSLDDFDVITGPVEALEAGTRFDLARIAELPHSPVLQCRGTLAHITGRAAGMRLEGLSDAERSNILRILTPRFPAAFGHDFPALKLRPNLADRSGTPTPRRVKAKPPEVVERALVMPAPEPEEPVRPQVSAVMRLRKSARRILLLSAQGSTNTLAEAFRQDGFKQVFEARTFKETQALAEGARFNLVILDNTMSGYWARDMMKVLYTYGLLLDTPIILLVECRNDISEATAALLNAVHIHERRESYDALLPVLQRLLLEDGHER